ncbi:MAG: hypothetical protein Q7S65_01285 [Nanoarchaeota archaeon]|nr:hypothetical protein [Nanoarchaeota archaeon]
MNLLRKPRVIFLLVCLLLAIVAIHPNPFNNGAAIRNVAANSSASFAGMESPKPQAPPMSREVITAMNNLPIRNLDDYDTFIENLPANTSISILTNKGAYTLRIEDPNNLGLTVYEAPKTNVRKGLDLQGGTRVLLQPKEPITADEMDLLIESMRQRLNVYGLSDLVIREANDLPPPLGSGAQYVVVEIAGATQEEVKDLLAQQGKFEATINNVTTFRGGDDIRNVCRSPDCSGLDPNQGCFDTSQGWVCSFRFSITLSQEAAQRFADATETLPTSAEDAGYLQDKLYLYLDGAQVDQLNVATDLRGRVVTDIQITGSGTGGSRQDAAINTLQNMKQLQTLLITGSLPVEIGIAKLDTISPQLGEEFIKNAFWVGLIAAISVAGVLYAYYRRFGVSLAVTFTMLCEVLMLFGLAALIGWNIDIAGIAGILVTVGMGVNDQVIITDETLGKKKGGPIYDWKERFKKAFFIIMAAYFTSVVSMIPLLFAGAGLLKGFAITTILGISIGVFITRPTFASVIEEITK